jgi:hypothetical protein
MNYQYLIIEATTHQSIMYDYLLLTIDLTYIICFRSMQMAAVVKTKTFTKEDDSL